MIAQEVEHIFPDWVVAGRDGYKAVGYPGFEALTVESFREIKNENEQLKAENSKLKIRLTSIEERLSAIESRIDASLRERSGR